jgi:hypothetical protein
MMFRSKLKLWLYAASALSVGAWALSRSARPSLLAALKTQARAQPNLPRYAAPPANYVEASARIAALVKARPDASRFEADGYFDGRIFYVSSQPQSGAWTYGGNMARPVDVYGRSIHGQSRNPLAPLMQAAQIALPFVPGVGPAASAAIAAAIAIGQGKSLKDAALAAARGAAPGGLAGQMAFDLGVAVASGERVDAAATVALLQHVPSGETAFELGANAALNREQRASVDSARRL